MGLSKKGRKPKPDHSQKCSAITWPPCSRTTNCSSSKFFCLLQCYPSPYPTWSKLVGPHNVGPICHEGNPPMRWGRFACRGWKERVWSQSQPRRGLQCSVLPTWPVASTIKAPHRLATHSSPRLPLRPPPLRSLTNSISSSPRRKARVSSHQAGKPGSSFPHAAMKNAPRCLCPSSPNAVFPSVWLVSLFRLDFWFLMSRWVCARRSIWGRRVPGARARLPAVGDPQVRGARRSRPRREEGEALAEEDGRADGLRVLRLEPPLLPLQVALRSPPARRPPWALQVYISFCSLAPVGWDAVDGILGAYFGRVAVRSSVFCDFSPCAGKTPRSAPSVWSGSPTRTTCFSGGRPQLDLFFSVGDRGGSSNATCCWCYLFVSPGVLLQWGRCIWWLGGQLWGRGWGLRVVVPSGCDSAHSIVDQSFVFWFVPAVDRVAHLCNRWNPFSECNCSLCRLIDGHSIEQNPFQQSNFALLLFCGVRI